MLARNSVAGQGPEDELVDVMAAFADLQLDRQGRLSPAVGD